MSVAGRRAEAERALAHTETYVAACRSIATVLLTPERVDELYRAEDGLRLAALDADAAGLAAAAAAAEGALDIERGAVGVLSGAWQGGTGLAAMDFLHRQSESAAQVVSGLRIAADALRRLRAELARLVDAKIDAAVEIDDRRAGQRDVWLIEARAVLGGVADDAALSVVREEIAPFVAADIAGDWVTAMTSATESVRAAYDGAIRSLNERAATRFEFPATPTAGVPAVRAGRNRSAPPPAISPPAAVSPLPAPTAAPAVGSPPAGFGASPADFGAMSAPAWPQPFAGAFDERDSPPLRKKHDVGREDAKPDKKPDDARGVEVKPTSARETGAPPGEPQPPPEAPAAQEVPVPAWDPEPVPPPPLAAEIPTDTPLDERTPCEIAIDELPQIGE